MADFYLDENVSSELAPLLNARGHDAMIARDALPEGTSDHLHVAYAARRGRILVTHNDGDFRLLHGAWRDWFDEWGPRPRPNHAGMLSIPQKPRLSVVNAANLIHGLVELSADGDALVNRFLSWSLEDGWQEAHDDSGTESL